VSISFRPAVRENVSLLIGVAGGTGSGKTWSAMALATGLANGEQFAVIDTENGRARHYADQFAFDVSDLAAPFTPDAYAEAILAADQAGYPVVVVDSASHEHAGDGGLLDMHEAEYQRMGGKDSAKMAAWIKPKMAHKQMVNKLLQVKAHVILAFRAQQSIEIVKDAQGKMQVVPKKTLTGLDGWIPIAEKNLPYELTLSFLLTADAPGVPKPIKLQAQHRVFVPLDAPLSVETGRQLGEWARGGLNGSVGGTALGAVERAAATAAAPPTDALVERILGLVSEEKREVVLAAIEKNRVKHVADPGAHLVWLRSQVEKFAGAGVSA
jgi:hypothetical protein